MTPLFFVLLVALVLLAVLGFASLHFLLIIAAILAVVLLLGFFIGGAAGAGGARSRRGYWGRR